MHMIKVPGSFHNGKITSIDVSPCNKLVVTVGKDGNCDVWDTAQLVSKCKLTSPSTQDFEDLKPLIVLESNVPSECNCIRFGNLESNTGKFLVSYNNGEVYQFELLANGGFEKKRLLQHENPIIEISLSLDDELVLMSTYHNEIIIYDLRFNQVLDILHLHLDLTSIKGLLFDNSHGQWLCSLGDDKLINIISYKLIWNNPRQNHTNNNNNNTNNNNNNQDKQKMVMTTTKRIFQYESYRKFNKLITNNSLNANSRVRRIDWSQDDKLISIPNSNRGKMSLVNVLFNDKLDSSPSSTTTPSSASSSSSITSNWSSWCSLVGHNFDCEVTTFNPSIFQNINAIPNSSTPMNNESYYIIATAGSDKTLAVWNTSLQAPIIVAQDITTSTILDLRWSKDGLSLFITSISGELLVLTFDDEELGKVNPDVFKSMITKTEKDWEKEYEEIKPKLEEIVLPSTTTENDLLQLRVVGSSSTSKTTSDFATPSSTTTTTTTTQLTKNGKKRILPILVSGSTINTELDKKKLNTTSNSTNSMEFDPPSYTVSKSITQHVKRKLEEPDEPKKKSKKDLQPIEFIGSVVINPSSSFSNVRLSIPKIRKTWELVSPTDDSLYLSVKNGNGNESGPSKIQLFKRNKFLQSSEDSQREIFCDFIPKKLLLSTGGEGLFWAVATIEGIIVVYSDSGKRILPPLVLGTPLSFLESKGNYLMAITCLGEIHVWNIKEKKLIFEPTSLFPLLQPLLKPALNKPNVEDDNEDNEQELYENDILTRLENLTLCSITSEGVPVVTLSNGNGYLYDKDMCTWSIVSDSWWAFGSQYWDNTLIDGGGSSENKNIISMLEKHTNEEIIRKGKNKFFNKIAKVMLMKEGFENLENIISINHLENKILIYRFLKDDKNFKYFLMLYVKKLIEMNFINRIYDIILNLKDDGDKEDLINEIVMLNPKLNDFVKSV